MSMLSANDRFEILDLCSRYHSALDRGDEEFLMDCWSRGTINYDSPFGKFSNWEKLRQFFVKELHGGILAGKRHILFNVVVREGDDVDTAFVDAEYLVIDKDHLELLSSGSLKMTRSIASLWGGSSSVAPKKLMFYSLLLRNRGRIQPLEPLRTE